MRPARTASGRPLEWERDGRDWPLRETSRFVDAAGLRWHVQQMGEGPVALLVHGTGSSTHSWRDVAPVLAESHTVVAIDLPGHGFTGMPAAHRQSLPGMAAALTALLESLGLEPGLAVGHSAGAAIVLRMALDGAIAPQRVISLNGALLPLPGLAGLLFPPVARLMGSSRLVPRLFAWRANDRVSVERLIAGTGSRLDERGIDLYARLVRSPQHAAAALAMMANWDLRPLIQDLPRLAAALHLVVAMNDKAVPPAQGQRVFESFGGRNDIALTRLPNLGHLAHEEQPRLVAGLVLRGGERASPGLSAGAAPASRPSSSNSPRCRPAG